jgi:hypothetical protein
MHPVIQVDPNEHNRANEQDFARQLSRLRMGKLGVCVIKYLESNSL